MRLFIRALVVMLGLTIAFALLGPMAPAGSIVRDWAESFREALNAWWGFPFGLPGVRGG